MGLHIHYPEADKGTGQNRSSSFFSIRGHDNHFERRYSFHHCPAETSDTRESSVPPFHSIPHRTVCTALHCRHPLRKLRVSRSCMSLSLSVSFSRALLHPTASVPGDKRDHGVQRLVLVFCLSRCLTRGDKGTMPYIMANPFSIFRFLSPASSHRPPDAHFPFVRSMRSITST